MLFFPIKVHDSAARRPSPSTYMRRLQEGIRAYRSGVRNTPLTRTLERWMDHRINLKIGNQVVPGAWEAYAKIFWEYVDAIDTEDDLQPYRFQKIGEIWHIHYAVQGVIKRGFFKDHRGLQHYAQLLANPNRLIDSVQLAELDNKDTLALIESERTSSSFERHDADSINLQERTKLT